jgi:hypothetical protein
MKAALARKPGYNDQFEIAAKLVIDDTSALPPPGESAKYKTKVVTYNLRETPIAHMRHQNRIDDACMMAADRFRRTVEASRIGGPGAIDPEKTRVDGNVVGEVRDSAIDAIKQVVKLQGKIGVYDFELLVQACAVGETLTNITRRFYPEEATKARSVYVGQRIRDALKIVAEHFGITDPRRSRLYRSLSALK